MASLSNIYASQATISRWQCRQTPPHSRQWLLMRRLSINLRATRVIQSTGLLTICPTFYLKARTVLHPLATTVSLKASTIPILALRSKGHDRPEEQSRLKPRSSKSLAPLRENCGVDYLWACRWKGGVKVWMSQKVGSHSWYKDASIAVLFVLVLMHVTCRQAPGQSHQSCSSSLRLGMNVECMVTTIESSSSCCAVSINVESSLARNWSVQRGGQVVLYDDLTADGQQTV